MARLSTRRLLNLAQWSNGTRHHDPPHRPMTRRDTANLLLAALPADEYARVIQSLERVPLKLKTLLHRAGEPVEHVYFPGGGFCSILTLLRDGSMVEVATVGREGVVGISAVLDGNPLS